MDYVELEVGVADEERAEIVGAMLADYPFEAFLTEAGALKAYIPEADYEACRADTEAVLASLGAEDFTVRRIARQNWNAEWESDFEPVCIGGRTPMRIRAAHHAPAADGTVDVVVSPRMSFGTGHHATTALMSCTVAEMGVEGLRGLDMGCGTGILSVVAVKFGAERMTAVDIDEWACDSCRESAALNGAEGRIEVLCGSAEAVAGRRFDFILANIGRNAVTEMMPAFADMLAAGGRCAMSGFFTGDAAAVVAAAAEHGMVREAVAERDGWAVAVCRRI